MLNIIPLLFGCQISSVFRLNKSTRYLLKSLMRNWLGSIQQHLSGCWNLYSSSHFLVGFMLHEFFLFILCGTSDVWLDLWMPSRALSKNVNCCVMEMMHSATFCTSHSGRAQADIIEEADMLYAPRPFSGRLTGLFSGFTQVELKFSCTS